MSLKHLISAVRRPSDPAVRVRWQIRRDLPQVLEIDEQCFGSSAWRENDFVQTLRDSRTIAMVADIDDIVAGYVVYNLPPTSLVIMRLGVMRAFRRRGIGTRLIDRLKSKLSPHRRAKAATFIDERDLDAQLFLRASGFRCTDIVRGFRDDGSDVYTFEYRVPREQVGP